MQTERISYGGWPNCTRVTNGTIELVITGDVGPRIIRFGFVGGANMFAEFTEQLGHVGGDEWRLYGGHRLWHAPEEKPRTYFPDNSPVTITSEKDVVHVSQPVEPATGIQKTIDISLTGEAKVRLAHRLHNQNLWPVELAVWSLSVMATGGTGVLPLPPRGSHEANLLPSSSLTLWPYTNLADPRWTFGTEYILLRQDPNNSVPQKIGALNPDGWMAYVNGGTAFVKTFDYIPGAKYPDMGCNAELFTYNRMLEVESLGPMHTIPAGGYGEHIEYWSLHRDVTMPQSDADVKQYIRPLI